MVRDKIIVFFGISGVGKTYLQHYLMHKYHIPMLVTHTTRQPRPNEQNGADYYFNTVNQFKHLDLMEFAYYNHNYYGSAYNDIKTLWQQGYHVISAVLDYHGVQAYINRLGAQVIPIYLFAKSNIVKHRLLHRNMSRVQTKERMQEHQLDLHNIYQVVNNRKVPVICINTGNWNREKQIISKILCK